jgi:hypothetical protein
MIASIYAECYTVHMYVYVCAIQRAGSDLVIVIVC